MNIIVGMMMPLMNWAPKPASNRSSFLVRKAARDLVLPAEDLDQLVAGEGLLDDRR